MSVRYIGGVEVSTRADAEQVRVNGPGTPEGRVLAMVRGRPRTVSALVVVLGLDWWEVVRAVVRLRAEGEIYTRSSWCGDAVWERCG